VETEGGDAGGECCQFPFMFKKKEYKKCTEDGGARDWCFVKDGERWGYCKKKCTGVKTEGGDAGGGCCTFPFTYKKIEYNKCTDVSSDRPWCYAEGGKWGYCKAENECLRVPNPCNSNANCVDTPVSFKCTCKDGYVGDGINSCSNENECLRVTKPCNSNANCEDTLGSFKCTCKDGYVGNGISCANENECARLVKPCDSLATCIDTVGSYKCTCKAGYVGSGACCKNEDECARDKKPCHAGATCTDTVGSHICKCKAGYTGDGVTCTNVNECAGKNTCTSSAICKDTIGSYKCLCKAGYIGNGVTCKNENECQRAKKPCHALATCTDTNGSYKCTCKAGYSGNGVTTCTLINICKIQYTNYNTHGNGNMVYLDRHPLRCGSRLMSKFHFERSGGWMRYQYSCCNIASGTGSCRNKESDSSDDGRGSAVYLDRHGADCGIYGFITYFRVARDGSNKIQYKYRCCDLSNKWRNSQKCKTAATKWTDSDGSRGHVYFLDRQTVACGKGHALSYFRLQRNSRGNEWRYNYRCCKFDF